MGASSTDPYRSGYENINNTMSHYNNNDSSYSQFTIKYYLVDEVKTIQFYCQSLIVKYGIFGNLLFLFLLLGRIIYSFFPIEKCFEEVMQKEAFVVEKHNEYSAEILFQDLTPKIQEKKEKNVEMIEMSNRNSSRRENNDTKDKYEKMRKALMLKQEMQNEAKIINQNNILIETDNLRYYENVIYAQITCFKNLLHFPLSSKDKNLLLKGKHLIYSFTDIEAILLRISFFTFSIKHIVLSEAEYELYHQFSRSIISNINIKGIVKEKKTNEYYNMLKNSISKFRNNNKKTIYDDKIINFFKIFVQKNLIDDYKRELYNYYNLLLNQNQFLS